MRRKTGLVLAAGLLVAAAPHSGGWAVTTVHDLPTHFVAGQANTITFTVRQHGTELVRGHDARVMIRMAGRMSRSQRVDAVPTRNPGEYTATFTPDAPGMAMLSLHAFRQAEDISLLPLAVIAKGAPAPVLTPEARGRDLFVAKGCVTCHLKADDPEMFKRRSVDVGPALGGRRFDAEWLAAKISDPDVGRVRFNEYVLMPKLELNPEEVSALVAYVNQRVVASR